MEKQQGLSMCVHATDCLFNDLRNNHLSVQFGHSLYCNYTRKEFKSKEEVNFKVKHTMHICNKLFVVTLLNHL